MKYQSLDFPASAHPDASTVLGCARRLQAIAVACRTFVRPFGISAWRIKQAHFLSASHKAQSQKIQGIQAIEELVSGGMKTGLLPTCCLRIAAQGYAGRQVGSISFRPNRLSQQTLHQRFQLSLFRSRRFDFITLLLLHTSSAQPVRQSAAPERGWQQANLS